MSLKQVVKNVANRLDRALEEGASGDLLRMLVIRATAELHGAADATPDSLHAATAAPPVPPAPSVAASGARAGAYEQFVGDWPPTLPEERARALAEAERVKARARYAEQNATESVECEGGPAHCCVTAVMSSMPDGAFMEVAGERYRLEVGKAGKRLRHSPA